MQKRGWGFNSKELNTKVRPQDDFYEYVNGEWKKKHPIPAHESRWGTFMELRFKTDQQLRKLLSQLLKRKQATKGSAEQMIRDFYLSGMDMKERNSLGIKPLDALRKKIAVIKSKDELLKVIAHLHCIGSDVVWGAGIDQDDKNSEQYVLRLMQGGIGMPDREYYLKSDAESIRVRDAYQTHVTTLFKLMGRTQKEAAHAAESFLAFEIKLAKASSRKEDLRDPHKNYHKMTVPELARNAPRIDWTKYLRDINARDLKTVIVNQPQFFKAISELFEQVPLDEWKQYLEWHVVNGFAFALSEPFIKENFSFYGTVLSGTKKMQPLWRRVLRVVNGALGEALGQLYVKEHFSSNAKRDMLTIVADLFTAYEARIKGVDWMTPATKKKALAKLRVLNRKIGYPDKWRSYQGLIIRPDDFVGNVMRSNEFEHDRALGKLGKPIRRWEWYMYPQTVNAYFAPNLNDIVFPAAILQAPFFSTEADDALNYGCIGAVIGHEITHGFDDEGSKFDNKGNLKNWWTTTDRKRFEKRADVVRKQFDSYEVADGVKVNGRLTLGENIADLGGLSIALDAYKLRLKRSSGKIIDGFTPEQRFFLGFALFERENVRPEFEKMQVLTDPHSPGKFRINGPLSNLPEFYESFKVTKGDGLYRSPKERAKIW